METIKNITLGFFLGLWDSIRGCYILLYIDAEIHKVNIEQQAEKRQRLMERQRYMRRSPSPTPSSASAMAREERESAAAAQRAARINPDERRLENMVKNPKPSEEQKTQGERKIGKQVLKCCLLNGGFTWLSIVIFEKLLLPTLRFVLILCYGEHSNDLNMVWGWLQSVLSIIFGMMWVLPIFLLSKIVSSLWFADIANAAYRVRKGQPHMITGISKLVADFLFSLVVQALFLVQSMLVNLLPVRYVGETLCFVHLCLLYSLYSFEYKWFNMGWELHRRLSYIENNWPYFLGFGVPLTVLTNMSSSVIVSGCIFSIFFPIFILSGNEAKPLVGTTDIPLRLFSPVIFASNLFFNRSGGGTQKYTSTKVAQQQQQQLSELQKQQKILLKQQMREYRSSPQRQTSSHRYQQPPTLLQPQIPALRTTHSSSSSSSPMRSAVERRGHYMGGMRPLIPTPASISSNVSSEPEVSTSRQTAHKR